MLLRNVLAKTLRDLRWPTFWTGLGLAVLSGYFMWIYPTFAKTMDLQGMLDKFPAALKALIGAQLIDLSTPTGFLNVELFPLMLPIVLGGCAIALASGATAGEEARGTIDVLLSEPVERWRVVTEKSIAIIVATVVVSAAMFLGLWLGGLIVGSTIALDRVVAGIVMATLLAFAFGGMALAIACWSGNRGMAIGITAAVLVVTYFVNALSVLVDALDRIKGVSPFYYYLGNDPLRNGIDIGHAAVLLGVAVIGYGLALVAFERRDLAA